jgi:hypothetical protein
MRASILSAVLGVLMLPAAASAQYPRQVYSPAPPAPVPVAPVPAQFDPDAAASLVRHWYRVYLNREGDPGGVATWVESLRQGNAPESTLATILASDEYYRKAGGTPEGVVQKLFVDITGRRPTSWDEAYWVDRMYRGERMDVIYDLLVRHPQHRRY